MEPVTEHPVPAGPLAVRWRACELRVFRAGVAAMARIELENAGSAAWRSRGKEGVQLAYHWLDELGNAIVWDGIRHPFARPVEPGACIAVDLSVLAPIPPGPYRLAFDLVEEHRFWFADVGNTPLELELPVLPRIDRRALAVRGADPGALAGLQEQPVPEAEAVAVAWLGPGVTPAPDWSRRVLDAHAEGYALVGGSIEPEGSALERRRLARAFAPWAPGSGRNPTFEHPLLCPSALTELALEPEELHGLPAARPPEDATWIHDGRIAVRFRPRSGRRSA
jgi:hypothetical protein